MYNSKYFTTYIFDKFYNLYIYIYIYIYSGKSQWCCRKECHFQYDTTKSGSILEIIHSFTIISLNLLTLCIQLSP